MATDEKLSQLKAAKETFFSDLATLATAIGDRDQRNASFAFSQSAYEYGRLRRLTGELSLSADDDARLRANFEPAIIEFGANATGITSTMRAEDRYEAKRFLSTFEFILVDFMQLYKKDTQQSERLQTALDTIKHEQCYIDRRIDGWRYSRKYEKPDERLKPCLDGIPREHKWWNDELGRSSGDVSSDEADWMEGLLD